MPSVPPLPGLDSFAGPAFHTARWRHDVPLAGKRVAVIGTGCSAVQVVPAIADGGRAARRLPALARLDDPEARLRLPAARAGAVRALPGAAAARPRLDLALPRVLHPRHDPPQLAARAAARRAGGFNIRRGIKDPALRRRVTPTDEVGCKRVMLTDDWYPALARPNVDAGHRGHRRDHARRRPHPRRARAAGRRARPRHRLQEPRVRRADGDRRRRRTHARRGVGARRAGLPRRHRARLPEPVPALRPQHQRRHRLGGLDDRVLDRARAGGAARVASAGAPRRSRSGARPPTRSTPRCARRWRARSGTRAARTGTSTSTATTPATGRGRWLEYRRRTATLAPDAYTLS